MKNKHTLSIIDSIVVNTVEKALNIPFVCKDHVLMGSGELIFYNRVKIIRIGQNVYFRLGTKETKAHQRTIPSAKPGSIQQLINQLKNDQ